MAGTDVWLMLRPVLIFGLGSQLAMAAQLVANRPDKPSGPMPTGSRVAIIAVGVVVGLIGAPLLRVVSNRRRRDSARHDFEGQTIKGGPAYSTPGWVIGGVVLVLCGLLSIGVGVWAP